MKEAEPNNKVLLGMSGGTDSSVAALLLQDAGYEVTGITFRFYEKGNDTEYLEDARTLCERLGIPHLTYDVRGTFRKTSLTISSTNIWQVIPRFLYFMQQLPEMASF